MNTGLGIECKYSAEHEQHHRGLAKRLRYDRGQPRPNLRIVGKERVPSSVATLWAASELGSVRSLVMRELDFSAREGDCVS